MKLIADEGFDKYLVGHLRDLGCDITYILEVAPGSLDEQVLSIAKNREAILLTLDTDFGELVYRLKESTHGVLLFRLSGLSKDKKRQLVASVLALHGDEFEGCFSVVTKDTVRIRKL